MQDSAETAYFGEILFANSPSRVTNYLFPFITSIAIQAMYIFEKHLFTELVTRFATTTTRQRNRASVLRKKSKNVKVSVSIRSSHNE